ncbi:SAM-dependent methyltransferase [Curtobacterium sp. SGAir0471]|nr:SAM-dependent methyltransferase [Curtobacterium sp. SGAir0471]
MRAVHPEDRALVEAWADATPGLLLDVGYGPGHWAAHLHRRGHVVVGIEPVPRFVALARAAAPEVEFRPGTSEATGLPDAGAGGVLSWYALVHHEPTRVPAALAEVHRVLAPDGTLLVGFFEGPTLEPFDHAVTTAYRWPVERMVAVLQDAGFTVDTVQRRADVGARPHAAVIARRS